MSHYKEFYEEEIYRKSTEERIAHNAMLRDLIVIGFSLEDAEKLSKAYDILRKYKD